NAYNETIKGYDKNGNITGIIRNGNNEIINAPVIDNLSYVYQTNSNKLLSVADATTLTEGFNDGNKVGNDYAYDVNGNLTVDKNKGITKISYNYLNLPTEVLWNASKKINYTYDASGVKLRKVVTDGTTVTTTDYLGGFQYQNNVLQFFPTTEGYVNVTNGTAFSYVYNYTDHLGNVRLSYQKNTDGTLKVLEENNYYPFGLKHSGYNNTNLANTNYKYKYNGKELQEEFNINLYDYGARNYDPAIGRWFNIDPMADEFENFSPYNYVLNNPIRMTDPNGMAPDDIIIRGQNNSSVTIKTDLIDISVNAGSIVGDLGGNYTLNGADVLTAALDIVGVFDPTGAADVAAASLEASQGNWWSAAGSALGVVPVIGDAIGKSGKIGKHVKTIDKAIDAPKKEKKIDFIVTPDGVAVPKSQSRMKEGFEKANFPSNKAGQSAEKGKTYTVPTKNGKVDVRTMEGSKNHPKRAVITHPGTNSPKTPSGKTTRDKNDNHINQH
ncbi:MAG: RHS repeat-associated core domain-containing protein, partial [Empedobacter falsenii]